MADSILCTCILGKGILMNFSSPCRGHLQFWMLWDEWYLNHRLTSGKQGTVIFRLISSLPVHPNEIFQIVIQKFRQWRNKGMLKEQNICSCTHLLVSCFLLVENICAPQAGWASQTEMLSVPSKYWVLSSLCPSDTSSVFPSQTVWFLSCLTVFPPCMSNWLFQEQQWRALMNWTKSSLDNYFLSTCMPYTGLIGDHLVRYLS